MSPSGRLARCAPWVMAAGCIGCLVPFLGKAFHIDEPLFLWSGRQIQTHPGDPFGFDVNWDLEHRAKPMWQVTQNPPLACYYAALAAAAVGWSETALHSAFLLPAVGAIIGTWYLAGRLGASPLVTALLLVLTPVFLIIGASVTSDVPMLCAWVWAVVCWDIGLRDCRTGPLYMASLLVVMATLTKYFGVSLVPLLAAHALALDRRGWRRWLAPLAVACAALVGYQLVTRAVYGRGHLFGAAVYALDFAPGGSVSVFWQRGLMALAFLGGGNGVALFLLPLALSWRRLLVIVPVVAVSTLIAFDMSQPWWLTVQIMVWSAVGTELLAVTGAEVLWRRDAPALLVALWIGGTFIFTALVNHSVNGRSVLPAMPALGIVLAWRLERLAFRDGRVVKLALALIPAATFSLLTAWADQEMANVTRDAARRIAAEYARPGRTLWFHGHWGWQYYLERFGGRSWDTAASRAEPGDYIALADNNDSTSPPPADCVVVAESFAMPACSWLATMNPLVGAGFYSHSRGPLPFVFGPIPPERFDVLRVKRPIVPSDQANR